MSALAIPFISSALYVLRLPLMKALFWLLYAEARRSGKPIVYLAHPAEFLSQARRHFEWSYLSLGTLRTHGFRLRKRLFVSDPDVRLDLSRALFSYIATFPGIRFMTMREYATSRVDAGSV